MLTFGDRSVWNGYSYKKQSLLRTLSDQCPNRECKPRSNTIVQCKKPCFDLRFQMSDIQIVLILSISSIVYSIYSTKCGIDTIFIADNFTIGENSIDTRYYFHPSQLYCIIIIVALSIDNTSQYFTTMYVAENNLHLPDQENVFQLDKSLE